MEYRAPRSVKIPAEARTDIFPSPFGSHAKPKRGVKMLYRLCAMLFSPPRPLRIAGENQAGGRDRINRAVHVLIEQVQVEMVKPSVFVFECEEWFPTQTVIDGETLRRLP